MHIDLQVSRKRNKCFAIIEIGNSFYNRGILVCDGLCDIAVFCPFINKLLDCLSKQQYIALIAAINIICVILPTVLVWERDLITTGMDYEWLIPLYIIGGYIRKFGIPCGKNKALVGYVLCSLITGLVRVPLGLVSNRIVGSYVLSGLFFGTILLRL